MSPHRDLSKLPNPSVSLIPLPLPASPASLLDIADHDLIQLPLKDREFLEKLEALSDPEGNWWGYGLVFGQVSYGNNPAPMLKDLPLYKAVDVRIDVYFTHSVFDMQVRCFFFLVLLLVFCYCCLVLLFCLSVCCIFHYFDEVYTRTRLSKVTVAVVVGLGVRLRARASVAQVHAQAQRGCWQGVTCTTAGAASC